MTKHKKLWHDFIDTYSGKVKEDYAIKNESTNLSKQEKQAFIKERVKEFVKEGELDVFDKDEALIILKLFAKEDDEKLFALASETLQEKIQIQSLK